MMLETLSETEVSENSICGMNMDGQDDQDLEGALDLPETIGGIRLSAGPIM